ncbi:MAG: iron dependent repressor, metal binding and dimerization domain protein [Candidatus Thorarchaeota archaeon]
MLDIDYKIICYLNKNKKRKVGDIARHFKLAHSTVGSSVKRLEEEYLVVYKRYQWVELTIKGKNIANELLRHAHLLELLLHKELGLTVEQANQESAKFNLLFSCDTINKICEKYNHPKMCPCGVEINITPNCFCEEDLKNS